MSFTLLQAGTGLQLVTSAGVMGSALTLPTNITLDSTKTPRFAVYGKYVVMVNSPSRPLIIDGTGTVRVLTPMPPSSTPTLTATGAGTLSGTYTGVAQTFVVKDSSGNIISESGYGPAATGSVALNNNFLKAANLTLSGDTVTGSRLYRPTTQGTILFQWVDLDGNTQTSVQDDTSDAGISLVAAPVRGSAPDLTLIAEWRARLFGVSRTDVDTLRWTEAGTMYAWGAANTLPIPRIGADTRGITAFAPRREFLGVGRRNLLQAIVGTSNSDFRVLKISDNVGIESQESVVVIRDTAFFLWKDGVYTWGQDGVQCISDGKVRNWFATDTTFNRAVFNTSFAHYDSVRNKYRLFLAAAGGTTINRWVEYDLTDKTWWGPHRTSAFSPTCAVVVPNANDTLVPMIGGSDGNLYQEQATRTDGTSTAISSSWTSKFHDGGTPHVEKYWDFLTVLGVVQAAGTVTVTPTLGYLNSTPGSSFTYDLTKGRHRIRRLGGPGKLVQLNFAHATVAQGWSILGYEIPFFELGIR